STPAPTPAQAPAPASQPGTGRRKLSYKDARELEQLPARIEALEAELSALAAAMSEPGFYQQDAGAVAAHAQRMAATQEALDQAYARWAELDG
ncbi:MAG TPA: ABC transporter ATP-binding protein, partial [Pseudoxanthomonas sp.]|nr:ABC transporter ATP-binding protein [Pseudoxanthomonas sp.]